MSQVQIWICIRGKNVGSATRPATLSDPLLTDRQPCRIRYQQTSNPVGSATNRPATLSDPLPTDRQPCQ